MLWLLLEFGALGSGGDAPAFIFVIYGAPLYVVAYGLLAGSEYGLRSLDLPLLPLVS